MSDIKRTTIDGKACIVGPTSIPGCVKVYFDDGNIAILKAPTTGEKVATALDGGPGSGPHPTTVAAEYSEARKVAERASASVKGAQNKVDANRYALAAHMKARDIAKKKGMLAEAKYHQTAVEKHLKPVKKELSKYLSNGREDE